MKRRDLIKKLDENGKRNEPIGRHTGIDDIPAKRILRRNGIK